MHFSLWHPSNYATSSIDLANLNALNELSLDIASGDYVALLGENGCGKTTALRVIAGLVKPSSGSVFLDEKCVDGLPPRRRPVGMMMQGTTLYPHLNVEQNIRFGLSNNSKTDDTSISRAIEIVDVGGLMDRFPHQLSGGQSRRVAIAKTITGAPPIRLLDEPLSAIDSTTRAKLERDLVQIHKAVRGTTIHVTHDADEAMRIADKIAVMHLGSLLQYDSPETISRQPNSVQVADRIASSPMNWFQATVSDNSLRFDESEAESKGDWSNWLTRFDRMPTKILIGVRPDCFQPLDNQNTRPCITASVENVIERNVPRDRSVTMQLFADAEDVLLFDAETGRAISPAVFQ